MPERGRHTVTLQELRRRLRLPVIVAPMFLVSGPEMVIAASKAGVIGAFPSINARSAEEFESWLERIVRETDEGLKAWRDVWSAGHGVGLIDDVPSVAELLDRLEAEYCAARVSLAARCGS